LKLEECIENVERYLRKEDTQPRFVNIRNTVQMKQFRQHFQVGDNLFKSVKDYAGEDDNPKIDKLLNDIKTLKGTLLLNGFTTHLMLMGEDEVKKFISQLLHTSSAICKIVVICYQCEKYLGVADVRQKRLIYDVYGQKTPKPQLVFLTLQVPVPEGKCEVIGIEHVSSKIEEEEEDTFYIRTSKRKSSYSRSLYHIVEQHSPFCVLCSMDSKTEYLLESFGTNRLWGNAMKYLSQYHSWAAFLNELFGNCNNLELAVGNWRFFDEERRWLLFIALKLYGASNSWCLQTAIKKSNSIKEFIRSVFRGLLDIDWNDADFWKRFDEWKNTVKAFGYPQEEVADYCSFVICKGKYALYYLTDATDMERKQIIGLLDVYGLEFSREELLGILEHIYPPLYAYLLPYDFRNELLNRYFQEYKYQKVINKLLQQFETLVEKQAVERDYNLLLPHRSEKIEAVEKKGTHLYFMDAMGVEFLGFILDKCHEKEMQAYVTVCKCELPSITCFNKEFIDVFEEGGATLIPDRNGIKDLDEMKHHGEKDYDFNKNKLPFHLIRELEIIENVLDNIKTKLVRGQCERAVMISDHGSSRLSVLKCSENKWTMKSKGEHSGRCCPKDEMDGQPLCATESNGFWVLANYDRFKGGRKANVEVHGGASLEEVTVPIIEITYRDQAYEIYIKEGSREIVFNTMKKNGAVEFFSKTKLGNVTVCMNGKTYDAHSGDGQNFVVKLPDLRKEGSYSIDVYSSNNRVASGLVFYARKQGMQVNKLL